MRVPLSISVDLVRRVDRGRAGRVRLHAGQEGRRPMGVKTGALATQLEGKARDAVATLEKLGDADWKKVTAAEKWTVAATAHHLAGGLGGGSGVGTGPGAG